MKNIHTVTVTGNKNIADGIYAMTLRYKEEEAPEQILPGQFVGVYSKDSARLLPRPISICRWISEDNSIVLVYRVVGAGTEEFASCKKGDTLRILDVLGNKSQRQKRPSGRRRHRRTAASGACRQNYGRKYPRGKRKRNHGAWIPDKRPVPQKGF